MNYTKNEMESNLKRMLEDRKYEIHWIQKALNNIGESNIFYADNDYEETKNFPYKKEKGMIDIIQEMMDDRKACGKECKYLVLSKKYYNELWKDICKRGGEIFCDGDEGFIYSGLTLIFVKNEILEIVGTNFDFYDEEE